MTPEGEAIIRYTLRNDSGAEVQLTNYGAAIVSVKMPDREGRMADVVLGYKHPEGYFFDGAASGKSVGRCANRIAFGQMTVEGKEYRLEVNNGVNHLHGGTKNFANRIWESRVETNRVVMSLVSEDGDQGYPGELCVEAVFDFDDDNALEITYLARTDKTTVVNLTNHVYFNLAGEGSGSVLDHELRLNSSKILEMNERQIPTGKLLDAAGTPQDFREFRSFRPGISSEFNHIRDFKGYDHPFVVDGWKPNILGEVGTLREPRSGRSVTVLSSQPSVMIYTGNWLAGGCPETKSGGRYNDYDGVTNIKTINDNAGTAPVQVDDKILGMLELARQMYNTTDGKLNIAMGSVLRIWHDYREAAGQAETDADNKLPSQEELDAAARHCDINNLVMDEKAKTVYLADPEMSLDVGSVGKGYAVEMVCQAAEARGLTSALVSVGGNLRAIGVKPDGSQWTGGVENPWSSSDVYTSDSMLDGAINMSDMALVTSGDYQRYYVVDGKRYHHLIDPDTLFPAAYFNGVTVLCSDSGLADCLTTGLFCQPLEDGMKIVESLDGVEAMWCTPDQQVITSSGWDSHLKK